MVFHDIAETWHRFDGSHIRWGFTEYMPLNKLNQSGYLVNDRCIIEATVVPDGDSDNWAHDSKKESSYTGLKNERATGCMNSLLQTLYHIPYFRKVIQ